MTAPAGGLLRFYLRVLEDEAIEVAADKEPRRYGPLGEWLLLLSPAGREVVWSAIDLSLKTPGFLEASTRSDGVLVVIGAPGEFGGVRQRN